MLHCRLLLATNGPAIKLVNVAEQMKAGKQDFSSTLSCL